MTDWSGINYAVDPQTAAATHYDVVVVGSGVTGAEFASAYNALGVEVTLVSRESYFLTSELTPRRRWRGRC